MTHVMNQASGKDWVLYQGDCVQVAEGIPDNSIDFSVYSPPFEDLYIYSDSEADMGNSADGDEFFEHYRFLIKQMYRMTLPGRLTAVHCKDLPTYMGSDGAAGLRDFPGDIIRAHEDCGWHYHSRVTIWKDPVIERARTNNHGLLHKNFAERSEACRQGMADYLIVFRKWPLDGGRSIQQRRVAGDYIGTNPPADNYIRAGKFADDSYSIAVWQRYASPVWFDIDQTRVLNYKQAKESEDSKHICPLQLDVIERAIDLWSAPGETVLSPFAGIGSEPYCAVKMHRRGVGIELKESYFNVAIKNCEEAEAVASAPTLWDLLPAEVD